MTMREFDETYMSRQTDSGIVGFGSANRTPGSRVVSVTPAKSPRQTRTLKGLARSCVLVVKKDARTYDVYVKGSGALLGTIRSAKGAKGSSYSYKLVSEARSHAGFGSQGAAVARMLEKV